MQNGQSDSATALAFQFSEEVLEKISFRLKLAADSPVGRYMVTTLKKADQIAFDYWRDYVAHVPAWEAARLTLQNAALPPQFRPRTVEEMLGTWLSIAIRLGVSWPKMTGEQIEEMNEYRRLLNEAIELIDPSARTFDRIGKNIARAIESFGVCLDDVKNPLAHDELTIIMGFLDILCRDGVNTHEDVLGEVQHFIVSHLGRLSVQESVAVDAGSLQAQLQEALADNRRINDQLVAARSLINTQYIWKERESVAQEIITTLEESVRALEAQLAKNLEQAAARSRDATLRELHDKHFSILQELVLLRAQRSRIAQEMANAQKDHQIALEHGHANTMNKRLDAVIGTAQRIKEIGDTITHLEKLRLIVEKKMEDRTHELQSELLGEIYFDTERQTGTPETVENTARPTAEDASHANKESLERRVNESVSLFVSRTFQVAFEDIIKAKAVPSLWALLEEMPHRRSFRKEVKRNCHLFMPNFDGLCKRLLWLDLWNNDKSALDHVKVDAFLISQGF